jgi:hypothetical protein
MHLRIADAMFATTPISNHSLQYSVTEMTNGTKLSPKYRASAPVSLIPVLILALERSITNLVILHLQPAITSKSPSLSFVFFVIPGDLLAIKLGAS